MIDRATRRPRPRAPWRLLLATLLAALALVLGADVHAAPAEPAPAPVIAPPASVDAVDAAAAGGPALDTIIDDTLAATMPKDQPPASGAQTALKIFLFMTVLSLLPAIALSMTCFTRIIIVFSFLRQALGLPGAPPNQVLTGMALFLTMFVMAPVFGQVHQSAIEPLQRDEIGATEALQRASVPMKAFMLRHTNEDDLRLLHDIAQRPAPATAADVSLTVLVPAYTLSEVRTAFTMGFLILVPFLVIDLVVSSVLMAMGMVMLPPALVTLPLKVLVFVLADGWGLVVASLARSLMS
ncbi:MAG: flagellar type III secretion system pore protein FliP [Nannocystaceae bacterium]